MKKQDMIDILQKCINEKTLCKCNFSYENEDVFIYPLQVNENLILAQLEDEFLLNGYCIYHISKLANAEIMDNKYNDINKMIGNTDRVINPDIDISNWYSVFNDLSSINKYIQIEDAINEQYAIGSINKVLKDRIYFKSFDANGQWDDDLLEIKYSQITSVRWYDRYSNAWKQYLERKKKIICYGDSNTYGYDPQGYPELRFAEDIRWIDYVAEQLAGKFSKVVNLGQNGREVPDNQWERAKDVAVDIAGQTQEGDLVIVMLGGNDLLLGNLSAKETTAKMRVLLQYMKEHLEKRKILLAAPIVMKEGYWVPGDHYIEKSKVLVDLYEKLAGEMEVDFVDPNQWNIGVADDGVHFTAEGSGTFGENMTSFLAEKYL